MKKVAMLTVIAALAIAATTAVTAQTKRQPKAKSAPSELQQKWDKEPDTVLGVRLGQPLTASALPDCPEKSYEASTLCLITSSIRTPDGQPLYSVGGHPFSYAAVSIKIDETGVVSRLQIWMKQDRFAEFREALVTRYGIPTSQTSDEVQSRAGAVYPNRTSNWVGQKLAITALERFDKIDESMVIFSDNAATERYSARRETRTQDAASKL